MNGETSFNSEYEEELVEFYSGKCLKYGNTNIRSFNTKGVVRADFAVDIPALVRGCAEGDFIDYEDYTGKYERLLITEVSPSEMGTTVHFSRAMN